MSNNDGMLIDPSQGLDVVHHDVPERHIIGRTLLAPTVIKANAVAGIIGISDAPSREDHVHPVGELIRRGSVNQNTVGASFTVTYAQGAFPVATDGVVVTQVFAGTATAFAHVSALTASGFTLTFRTGNPPADVTTGFNWVGYYWAWGH